MTTPIRADDFAITPEDIEAFTAHCERASIPIPFDPADLTRGADAIRAIFGANWKTFWDARLSVAKARTRSKVLDAVAVFAGNSDYSLEWATCFATTDAHRAAVKEIVFAEDVCVEERALEWAVWVGDRREVDDWICARELYGMIVADWITTIGFYGRPAVDPCQWVNWAISSDFQHLEWFAENVLPAETFARYAHTSMVEAIVGYEAAIRAMPGITLPECDFSRFRGTSAWIARFGDLR